MLKLCCRVKEQNRESSNPRFLLTWNWRGKSNLTKNQGINESTPDALVLFYVGVQEHRPPILFLNFCHPNKKAGPNVFHICVVYSPLRKSHPAVLALWLLLSEHVSGKDPKRVKSEGLGQMLLAPLIFIGLMISRGRRCCEKQHAQMQ